jgi:hypothetical protein
MKLAVRTLIVLTALATIGPVTDHAVAQMYSNERDGTVIGGNVGYGWTKIEGVSAGEEFATDSEGSIAGALRFGFARSDYFMVSADFGGWVKNWQQRDVKVFYLNGTATWFPGGEGFFVRGTIGAGMLDVYLVTAASPINFQEAAFVYGGGLGYELRVSPEIALGLAFDYLRYNVGQFEDLEDVKAQTSAITFQVNYYFL